VSPSCAIGSILFYDKLLYRLQKGLLALAGFERTYYFYSLCLCVCLEPVWFRAWRAHH